MFDLFQIKVNKMPKLLSVAVAFELGLEFLSCNVNTIFNSPNGDIEDVCNLKVLIPFVVHQERSLVLVG